MKRTLLLPDRDHQSEVGCRQLRPAGVLPGAVGLGGGSIYRLRQGEPPE